MFGQGKGKLESELKELSDRLRRNEERTAELFNNMTMLTGTIVSSFKIPANQQHAVWDVKNKIDENIRELRNSITNARNQADKLNLVVQRIKQIIDEEL